MFSSSAIPRFLQIADLYAAADIDRAPASSLFDTFAWEDNAPSQKHGSPVGPHRRAFFQLTYRIFNHEKSDLLLASSPDQVLLDSNYLRPIFRDVGGFALLFKSELLAHQLASPANEFPFFYQPASLELPLSSTVRARLIPQFQTQLAAAGDNGPYRDRRIAALTAALLYDIRHLYEEAAVSTGDHRLCTQLVCRFDEVVLQNFQTHHTVEDYARLLHVSADHLSAEIKARTGRNARDIIAERLVTEARHLLMHTELQAGEIADRLGFGEPTHFTRFLKRHLKEGPSEFRRRIRSSPKDHRSATTSSSPGAMAV